MLQWAQAQGCPLHEETCALAAKNGHLEMLKWARDNGCPWNAETCEAAAANGQLEVLQWAWAHGCPWCWRTCAAVAAEDGHLYPEVYEWARAQGSQEGSDSE